MKRPRTAAFLLEIRLACHDARADVLAFLSPRRLQTLLRRMDGMQATKEAHAKLHDRFSWSTLPRHLGFLKGGACHGAPIQLTPGTITERQSAKAELFMSSVGVQWRVPSTDACCGFETAFILWEDMLEWELMLAPRRDTPGAFGRLATYDPFRALDVLGREGGVLFHDLLHEPYRVAIPAGAMDALLTHEFHQVRETAMTLLSHTRVDVSRPTGHRMATLSAHSHGGGV
jgi:hypothetical protein